MVSNPTIMRAHIFILIAFTLALSNFVSGQSTDLNSVVIIGNSTGFSTMKKNTLINVFKGRLDSWNNGNTVKIVLPSQKNESSTLTAKVIYGTTVKGMQKFWLSLVFQGRANPPVFLDSDEEIIRYIQKNPGSVGVINKNNEYPKSLQIEVTN
jgi:hypothetical protein